MSAPGVLRLRVRSGRHAAIVGALIQTRVTPLAGHLQGLAPALAPLPAFGRKLCDASRRKRKSDFVDLWSVKKSEALAGFHYLSVFVLYPDIPDTFLTADERAAVHEIVIALATKLVARSGKKRLSRAEAERWIAASQQKYPASEDDPQTVDPAYMRRLKRRLQREDAIGRTPVNPIPSFLFALLAPK
jgi:hypothetical protein